MGLIPDEVRAIAIKKLLSRVTKDSNDKGCWTLDTSVQANGYSRIRHDGKVATGHKLMYLMKRGELPDGHEVGHTCDTRNCIRLGHLRPITHADNMLAVSKGWAARKAALGETMSRAQDILRFFEMTCEPADAPVSPAALVKLEHALDALFAAQNIDIDFTRHFMQRVRERRISLCELTKLFQETYKRFARKFAINPGPDVDAVLTDMQTDIAVPFVLEVNWRTRELDLKAKTVIRKGHTKNFQGAPKFKVGLF